MLCLVAKSRPTLATPWTVAYQDPLSMGFSRQEFWGGFPCPPPIFQSWVSNPGLPHCGWILYHLSHQGRPRILEWVPVPSPEHLLNPGIKPRSPTLWVDSLPIEPLGKPKNTGVGSLSLLQLIFPTQGLNQGILHCRRILYQLSYEGSPTGIWSGAN